MVMAADMSRALRPGRSLRWLCLATMAMTLLLLAGTAQPNETAIPELESTVALYRAEGAAAALPDFQRLLIHYRDLGDREGEAAALRFIGESQWRLGELEQARIHLEQGLQLAREIGDRTAEGRVLNVFGLLEWDLGQYQSALDRFDQALDIAREEADERLEASVLNNRGLVRDELGDYEASLEDYTAALARFVALEERRGQGDALGNIGGVHLLLGRFEAALGQYEQALAISEELDSKPAMTIDHGNIALCLLGLGRTDSALAHFDQALELARQTGMRQEEAYWLRGKANALVRQGHYDSGLELYREALTEYERSGASGLVLDAQHDLGLLMLTLGDPVSAEKWFRQAIALAREISNQQALTVNLLALGTLQLEREQLDEARESYTLARERADRGGELTYGAESRIGLARVDYLSGAFTESAANASEALRFAQSSGAPALQAEAWFAMGEAAGEGLDPARALAAYSQALSLTGSEGDPDLLWQVHYGRGKAFERLGQADEAILELQAAVRIIEGVRERLREERFRAGWLEDKYQVYVDLIRLQLQKGQVNEAFETAERQRARSFLTQVERAFPASRNPQQAERQEELRQRILLLQESLDAERDKSTPERRQPALAAFSRELVQAESEYQALLDDMGSEWSGLKKISVPDLSAVQGRLAANEALVEYVVGEHELIVFLLRADRLTAHTAALSRAQLTAAVNLLREMISQPGADFWIKPAARLAAALIDPMLVGGQLDGVAHLDIVPHDILNYLPFALLPTDGAGSRLLVEDFSLSYLPAAAALEESEPGTMRKATLLAMAPSKARLRYAPEEAERVAKLFGAGATLLSGREATESAFKEQAGEYRVLHLATHGSFNRRNPLLSGLELEADGRNDGLLEVHEILGIPLQTELVTLSACQTGLASGWFRDIPAGDDFVGLTRAFLLAGSRSVLATLWEVDDRSTVSVMEGFYQRFGAGSERDQAQALASVQRKLKASADFYHPFYWAPFVLVGQHGRPMPAYAKGT